jgi:predicted transcriptional regulator
MHKKQARKKMFGFMVNESEKSDLDELAHKMRRSKSDAVRTILSHAIDGMRSIENDGKTGASSSS